MRVTGGLTWMKVCASRMKCRYTLNRYLHVSARRMNYPMPVYTAQRAATDGLGESGGDLKRFLEEVGTDPKEARYWLKYFKQATDSSQPCTPFAVVNVSKDVLKETDKLNHLCSSLSFLHRHGMKCVVVHGHQLPPGLEPEPHRMEMLRRDLSSDTMMLVSHLEQAGSPARPLFGGSCVIRAGSESDGIRGRVTEIDSEPIKWSLRSGHIPVISSLGESPEGIIKNIDLQEATAEISRDMMPVKVLLVNTHGGMRDDAKQVVQNVNLPADLQRIYKSNWCSVLVREQIDFISSLLNNLPLKSSVVITTAEGILAELFTHHGKGSLFRIREPVQRVQSVDEVDFDRLAVLLETSFGKELVPGYYEMLQHKLNTIYITESYSAVAIITEEGVTAPYLDKFAVSAIGQGDGTADVLWEQITADFPKLFWRSRIENKINSWYFKKSEGSWNQTPWTVFWYGIHGVNSTREASDIVDCALELPATLQLSSPKTHKLATL